MKIYDSVNAYAIHSRSYSETSLIVHLFTMNHGRIDCVAKGAKRPKSKWRGVLQPFMPLGVMWQGRGSLYTLSSAELLSMPMPLQGAYMAMGFYCNELLYRLLKPGDAHEKLFQCYQDTLQTFHQDSDSELGLRCFEKQLLKELGYELNLYETYSGIAIQSDAYYKYIPEKGFMLAAKPLNEKERQWVYAGMSLKQFTENKLSSDTAKMDIKRLMRRVLAEHLGEKPLFSRQLLGGKYYAEATH